MPFSKLDKTVCLDNISVGIICFDMSKKCVYTNQYIIDFFGENNMSNTNMLTIYRASVHNDDRINEIERCNDFFENDVDNHSTIRIYNQKLREYRWVMNKRSVIKNLDNKNKLYMYTLCDIQENKLLEFKLRDKSLKAEESYNHKSIFLANMSHEIRTPLNGIIGMLTLLEDTELNNEQEDYISMIKECSYNLMSIISDILDYSKLEVGKIKLDIKSMSLYECIETTNDIVLSKIYEKSLLYNYNISFDIPEYIYGDINRIKQIILNLLSNSIKFMEKGNILLNVTNISSEDFVLLYTKYKSKSNDIGDYYHLMDEIYKNIKDKDNINKGNLIYLRFDITDSGCGIDSLDTEKIFESFSQVNNSLTTKIYPGTGLGLSICKELVELMGGVIWLEWSELGKGSIFSFVLPFYQSETDCYSSELEIKDDVLKNANVLIVDDNVHNRISLSGIMNKWGMNPHVYSNGEEALYFSRIINFDIGLIDICMPKMDGLNFAMKFRNQEEFNNKTIPLIALSSLGDKIEINSKYFKTNLIKPIKESKLKNICIDVLQKRIITCENKIEKLENNNNEILDKYIVNNNLLDLKTNVRILIAEDVYINQKVIVSFLNKLGFNNIQVVDNGKVCLDVAKANDFDIILLDIIMPIMNGEIVLKELIKYYSKHQGVKPYIIAVTAYCLREDKKNYINMGFDDYIVKPVNIAELKKCLNNYIEKLLEN